MDGIDREPEFIKLSAQLSNLSARLERVESLLGVWNGRIWTAAVTVVTALTTALGTTVGYILFKMT